MGPPTVAVAPTGAAVAATGGRPGAGWPRPDKSFSTMAFTWSWAMGPTTETTRFSGEKARRYTTRTWLKSISARDTAVPSAARARG